MPQSSFVNFAKIKVLLTIFGDNVLVNIPDVDHGHLTPHNIPAVINETKGLYQFGRNHGRMEKS